MSNHTNEHVRKKHQDLLLTGLWEYFYFHQYDQEDEENGRHFEFCALDRWREYDFEGNEYWCYSTGANPKK